MQLEITNEEIYRMLQRRGYRIIVDSYNPSTSKTVVLSNKHSSQGFTLERTYNPDWDRDAIINDCIPDLLAWAGLRVVVTLDY